MNHFTFPHPNACPECGAANLLIEDAETTDGHAEIVFACLVCGTCCPLTCATGQATAEGGEC